MKNERHWNTVRDKLMSGFGITGISDGSFFYCSGPDTIIYFALTLFVQPVGDSGVSPVCLNIRSYILGSIDS